MVHIENNRVCYYSDENCCDDKWNFGRFVFNVRNCPESLFASIIELSWGRYPTYRTECKWKIKDADIREKLHILAEPSRSSAFHESARIEQLGICNQIRMLFRYEAATANGFALGERTYSFSQSLHGLNPAAELTL
jgi:hypothetical protein